jgi:hypothetical protein
MFQKYRTLIGLLVASVLPTACSNPVQEARRAKGIPWWVWLLVIVGLPGVHLVVAQRAEEEGGPTSRV